MTIVLALALLGVVNTGRAKAFFLGADTQPSQTATDPAPGVGGEESGPR